VSAELVKEKRRTNPKMMIITKDKLLL
jgi:hypothetical protein